MIIILPGAKKSHIDMTTMIIIWLWWTLSWFFNEQHGHDSQINEDIIDDQENNNDLND